MCNNFSSSSVTNEKRNQRRNTHLPSRQTASDLRPFGLALCDGDSESQESPLSEHPPSRQESAATLSFAFRETGHVFALPLANAPFLAQQAIDKIEKGERGRETGEMEVQEEGLAKS